MYSLPTHPLGIGIILASGGVGIRSLFPDNLPIQLTTEYIKALDSQHKRMATHLSTSKYAHGDCPGNHNELVETFAFQDFRVLLRTLSLYEYLAHEEIEN